MILDIINKKRLGKELSYKEIAYFFNAYLDGEIKDYQMSALLMAICINGMSDEEVFALTKIFISSKGTLLCVNLIVSAISFGWIWLPLIIIVPLSVILTVTYLKSSNISNGCVFSCGMSIFTPVMIGGITTITHIHRIAKSIVNGKQLGDGILRCRFLK